MSERHTKHFHPAIDTMLHCPCCKKGTLSVATFIVLEQVRVHFGEPVTLTSGPRCPEYNEHVGGAEYTSRHLVEPYEREPDAADIVVKDVSPQEVYDYLCSRPYANLLGLGNYKDFTHVDTRGEQARW